MTHAAVLLAFYLQALAAWGAPAMPVQFHEGASLTDGVMSASLPGRDVDGAPLCQIWVDDSFWLAPFDEAQQLSVVEHEVGHCLGFIHPDPPVFTSTRCNSVMSCPTIGVTAWDRARYWNREHPQLRLPMLAH
jgi:hypothetical protein